MWGVRPDDYRGNNMKFCRKNILTSFALFIVLAFILISAIPSLVHAEDPIKLGYSRTELIEKWRTKIQSFLDRDVIPIVDFLLFLPPENGNTVVGRTNSIMDEMGVALICLGGYKAPAEKDVRGYRWGYFIHKIVNEYPDRYVLSTNKGGNRNWWKQKGGKPRHFIDQLEQHVQGGDYPFISEIEFRHYMSNAQCKKERYDRDIDIPINGNNGHRLFRLSAETNVPFSIHLEPEDQVIDALEEMIASYPKAKVIWAHFGQIRHPEREKRFEPELVERLLKSYPNLYFDLSTGEPNRRYKCGDRVLDTVIWEGGFLGQKNVLKLSYKAILSNFSDRFVVGLDYDPSNRQSADYFRRRVRNIRLILQDLPDEAKHNISYRNAWFLLTGVAWK